MYYSVKYIQMYSVEQKNGVRGCYHAGSCWHTVFLHSTVLNTSLISNYHSTKNIIESELTQRQESFTYRCNVGGKNVFAHDPYVSEVTYTCDSYGMIPAGITFEACTDEPTCKFHGQVRQFTMPVHWSPLVRSVFRPKKVDLKSGLTLHPVYTQYS